jgi:hypothetical protein
MPIIEPGGKCNAWRASRRLFRDTAGLPVYNRHLIPFDRETKLTYYPSVSLAWLGGVALASLVFVHGIGVRAQAPAAGGEHPYKATCRAIRFELVLKQIDWTLVECAWGDDLGARLHAEGKSFPPVKGQLGVAARPTDPARLWELLLEDPGFELRALAAMLPELPPQPGVAPGQPSASAVLKAKLDRLVPTPELADKLRALELEAAFAKAVKYVQGSQEVKDAIRHPQAARAIARSIVATTLQIALDQGIPPPPALAQLDDLAADIEAILREKQLGERADAIRDYAASAFVGAGSRLATWWGVGQRKTLPQGVTPIAGDVIYYQAHGERIRARIHEKVAKAPPGPVALLAHSLGGIAAVEAMCENPDTRKRVTKFITAGSQSGFFYEIDALRTLPFGQALPEDFPDWLNFWDSRDFLSFVTKGVFSGGRSRDDVEIQSGLPFPASHSGYWRQPLTWERVKTFLAG